MALSVLPVCLFCLPVTLVYCGQTVGWIKMPLGTEVGLGPGDTVLDWDQLPHGKGHSPHVSAHVYCGQTAGWIRISFGTEIGLGLGDTALDGDPASPPRKGAQQPPLVGPCLLWTGETVAHLSNC